MEIQESSVIRDIAPQLLNFKPIKKRFVLINSSPKDQVPQVGGSRYTIPAKDKLHVEPHKRALDADGDPIPGTVIIEDRDGGINFYTGGEQLAEDAQEVVRHILGLHRMPDGSVSSASSRYALMGISLLPMNPTKDLWRAVSKDGEARNFLIRVDNAQKTLDEYAEKNARLNAAGMPQVHGGKVWYEAKAIIDEYARLIQKQAEIEVSPHEAADLDAELEFEAYARAKVQELANKAAETKAIDKVALAKELLDDPTVLARLRKTHRIRKVGHMELSEESLATAAQSGQSISESGLEA